MRRINKLITGISCAHSKTFVFLVWVALCYDLQFPDRTVLHGAST